MKSLLAIALLSACVVSTVASAQTDPGPPAADACPATARDLPMAALYGTWQARFDGLPTVATVRLGRHPDYNGVRGTITRGADAVAQLAGDIDDDGQLALDESQDGHSISGDWAGTLQPGSCGREFRGIWRNARDQSTHTFVLNKTGPAPSTE